MLFNSSSTVFGRSTRDVGPSVAVDVSEEMSEDVVTSGVFSSDAEDATCGNLVDASE